jgi:ABC-2 type transport system permease protein
MTTLTIAKREFGAFFKSPIAYIVLSIYLILNGILFVPTFFLNNQASMEGFFGWMPLIFCLICPAIAMRLLAEEKGAGTIELLLTMPVRDSEVVLGKYLAAMGFLAVGLLLTLPYAFTVSALGPMDSGPVITSYVGSLLLGGAYLSIGLFASSVTRHQIVAFVVALAVCFGLWFLGKMSAILPPPWGGLIQYISPQYHFEKISRGVIELRNLVYYISIIGVLLLASVQVLESRKWR